MVGLLEQTERVHHVGHLMRDRNEEASHEHRDLHEALAAGDGEPAAAVMVAQIEAARRVVFDTSIARPGLPSVNLGAGVRALADA